MGKEILMSVDIEIEKNKFYKYFSDYLYNGNKLETLNIMRLCKKLRWRNYMDVFFH